MLNRRKSEIKKSSLSLRSVKTHQAGEAGAIGVSVVVTTIRVQEERKVQEDALEVPSYQVKEDTN